MFVHDPSGLKLELSFDQAQETDLPVPIPESLRYRAAERWFDPAPYAALRERTPRAVSRAGGGRSASGT